MPEVWEGRGAGGGAEGAHLPDHPDHLQAALQLLELQASGQAALDSLQDALRILFITTLCCEAVDVCEGAEVIGGEYHDEAHEAVAELDDGDESGGHWEADHTKTRVWLNHVFTPHGSDFNW